MFGLGLNTDTLNRDCFGWCSSEAAKKNNSTGTDCWFIRGCSECSKLCPKSASAALSECSSSCAPGDAACAQRCLDLSKSLSVPWKPPASPDHFFKSPGKNPYWIPDPRKPASPFAVMPKFSALAPAAPKEPVPQIRAGTGGKWLYVAAAALVVVGAVLVLRKKKAVPNRRKRRRR